MKSFLFFLFFIFISQLALSQYGGYNPVGATNYLGSNSSHGVISDITYNDGTITSAASAKVYFIGSATNTQHQLLAKLGGASSMQIGNAILNNGTGGLFINNPNTGLEVLSNFNFNGQNGKVSTLRNANAISINNFHFDAGATITGNNLQNNVDGYLKKDGDGNPFTFPLSDAMEYAPMVVGAMAINNSLTAAYYFSSGSTAANFEGGPFSITTVSPSNLIVSSTEYWDISVEGTPTTTLTLFFQGDYSITGLTNLTIVGWNIYTNQWEPIPSAIATGLLPGNSISSSGNVDFQQYAAFTIGYIKSLKPTVTATTTATTCNQSNGSITAIGANGTPPYQYAIDGGAYQISNQFNGLIAGNHLLSIMDVNTYVTTITVTIASASPAGKIFAGNDTSIEINQALQLNAIDLDNTGYDQFQWSPPTGLNNPNIQNPIATINQDETFTVVATSPNGCKATAQITLKVYLGPDIYVPTGFTPNGDGKNDFLRAIPIGIKDFKYFMVFNRWGQKIFYTTNPSIGWDGKVGGIAQETATFVWQTEGIGFDGKIILKKGTVVLIR